MTMKKPIKCPAKSGYDCYDSPRKCLEHGLNIPTYQKNNCRLGLIWFPIADGVLSGFQPAAKDLLHWHRKISKNSFSPILILYIYISLSYIKCMVPYNQSMPLKAMTRDHFSLSRSTWQKKNCRDTAASGSQLQWWKARTSQCLLL